MGGSAFIDDDSAGSLVIDGISIDQVDSRGTGGNKGNGYRRKRGSRDERRVR